MAKKAKFAWEETTLRLRCSQEGHTMDINFDPRVPGEPQLEDSYPCGEPGCHGRFFVRTPKPPAPARKKTTRKRTSKKKAAKKRGQDS